MFFADIVGLSGSPPDAEIPSLTLLNGYTARLVAQNELNLREAWLRTELFGQRLALTAGRLDLTNYFDSEAFANDESTQFISDALVNNQMLGLAATAPAWPPSSIPKNGFRFKFGFQQSNTDATNLSDSLFTLTEVGYTFTPFALPEGTYRVWFRTDNTPDDIRQRLRASASTRSSAPVVGCSAAMARRKLDRARDHFYSVGVGFQNGLIFNPQDTWGVGYSQMELATGEREKLTEGYYNFHLTERLRLSFHLTHVLDEPDAAIEVRVFVARHPVPGGVLGVTRSRSHVYIATHSHSSPARSSPLPRSRPLVAASEGAGRQDHRPAIGGDDREPRLERHRVHGHQDPQDDRQDVSSATTSTRTW